MNKRFLVVGVISIALVVVGIAMFTNMNTDTAQTIGSAPSKDVTFDVAVADEEQPSTEDPQTTVKPAAAKPAPRTASQPLTKPVPRPTQPKPTSSSPHAFGHASGSAPSIASVKLRRDSLRRLPVRPSRPAEPSAPSRDHAEAPAPAPAPVPVPERVSAFTHTASIAFNAPHEIQLDDVQRVQLRLSLQKKIEELKRDIVESGTVEGASVQIGNVVTAKLSGDGFEITELTPAAQGIIDSDDTEWRWQVTPTEPGEHFLNVSLSTILNVGGKEITRSVKTYEHQIRVNVTVGQRVAGFVDKNWQWLWAVVVAPMAAFGWRKMRKVRSDE